MVRVRHQRLVSPDFMRRCGRRSNWNTNELCKLGLVNHKALVAPWAVLVTSSHCVTRSQERQFTLCILHIHCKRHRFSLCDLGMNEAFIGTLINLAFALLNSFVCRSDVGINGREA
jgi:hypothetical protein